MLIWPAGVLNADELDHCDVILGVSLKVNLCIITHRKHGH